MMGSLQSELMTKLGGEGETTPDDEQTKKPAPKTDITRDRSTSDMTAVRKLLELCDNNHARAAEHIGMSVSGFGSMMARNNCSHQICKCAEYAVKELLIDAPARSKTHYVISAPTNVVPGLTTILDTLDVSYTEIEIE